MATVHQDFAAGVLITNGLGAGCSPLITAERWHLFGCIEIIIPTDPHERHGGGGSYPLRPGEIQNLYKPVAQELQPDYYIPTDLDPLAKLKNLVIVRVNIKGHEVEKEYLMKPKPYKALINIVNLINTTDLQIKTTIKNLKLKVNSILVKLRNLRKS